MVARSILQMQAGIMSGSARAAAEAQEKADHLMQLATQSVVLGPGMHLEELEINDYPQVTRQNISKREPLLNIEEITGAKVQVKGQYFANPAKMPEGCRKLYVQII